MLKKFLLTFALALSAGFYYAQPVFIQNKTAYNLDITSRGFAQEAIKIQPGCTGEIKEPGDSLWGFLYCPCDTDVEIAHPGNFVISAENPAIFDQDNTIVVTYNEGYPEYKIEKIQRELKK